MIKKQGSHVLQTFEGHELMEILQQKCFVSECSSNQRHHLYQNAQVFALMQSAHRFNYHMDECKKALNDH